MIDSSFLQILSTRARKGVTISDIKVSVCTFGFDILYINGKPLLQEQLKVRREVLFFLYCYELYCLSSSIHCYPIGHVLTKPWLQFFYRLYLSQNHLFVQPCLLLHLSHVLHMFSWKKGSVEVYFIADTHEVLFPQIQQNKPNSVKCFWRYSIDTECLQHLYNSFEEVPGVFQLATSITSNDLEEIQKFLDTAVNSR